MAIANGAGGAALGLKAQNTRKLMLTLLRQQPIARVRLARETHLSTTTVTNLVAEMIEQGIVAESGPDLEAVTPGAGRPPLALTLRPESRCALGIQFGVRHVRIALIDLQANVLDHAVIELAPEEPAADAIAHTAAECARIIRRHSDLARPGKIVGAGVGASGLVQAGTGINVLAPNLAWHNVPMRDLFAHHLQMPVAIDNNVRCMALAESLYGLGSRARALRRYPEKKRIALNGEKQADRHGAEQPMFGTLVLIGQNHRRQHQQAAEHAQGQAGP